MNAVSLFSGFGGFDIPAEKAGFTTKLQVESDPYCLGVLRRHWPHVPKITDIREVNRASVGQPVTLIHGGFPCQPFSTAGQRRGADDDRYLWPEMRRVISEIRPTWVVAENVGGLTSLAESEPLPDVESETRHGYKVGDVYTVRGRGYLDTILEEIGAMDYAVTTVVVPAAGVGAWHLRYRVFIVATNAHGQRQQKRRLNEPDGTEHDAFECDGEIPPDTVRFQSRGSVTRPERQRVGSGGQSVAVSDATGERRGERHSSSRGGVSRAASQAQQDGSSISNRGESQSRLGRMVDGFSYWMVEPSDIPRVVDETPDRSQRLKGLGNAVSPPQALPIFEPIAHICRMAGIS